MQFAMKKGETSQTKRHQMAFDVGKGGPGVQLRSN